MEWLVSIYGESVNNLANNIRDSIAQFKMSILRLNGGTQHVKNWCYRDLSNGFHSDIQGIRKSVVT